MGNGESSTPTNYDNYAYRVVAVLPDSPAEKA